MEIKTKIKQLKKHYILNSWPERAAEMDGLLKLLEPKQITDYIPVECLSCGHLFKLESNGRRFRHSEKTWAITKGDNMVKCPHCGDFKLHFVR